MSRFEVPTPTEGRAPSHAPPDVRFAPGISLAKKLGWLSIGLGLAEVIAPYAVSALTGVRSPALIQAYGLREIVCGIGILSSNRPAGWMWGRVAGDALDLATLGVAALDDRSAGSCQLTAAAAVLGVTALDVAAATQLSAAAAMEGRCSKYSPASAE